MIMHKRTVFKSSLFIARKFVPQLAGFLLAGVSAWAGTPIWNGTGAGFNNWSVNGNWLLGSAPGSGDNVQFADLGATTVSNIDNVVDAGFGGTISSLQYGNTNNFHTTLITNGVTLNITGAGGLTVGTLGSNPNTEIVTATVTGPNGALNVNNAA